MLCSAMIIMVTVSGHIFRICPPQLDKGQKGWQHSGSDSVAVLGPFCPQSSGIPVPARSSLDTAGN